MPTTFTDDKFPRFVLPLCIIRGPGLRTEPVIKSLILLSREQRNLISFI